MYSSGTTTTFNRHMEKYGTHCCMMSSIPECLCSAYLYMELTSARPSSTVQYRMSCRYYQYSLSTYINYTACEISGTYRRNERAHHHRIGWPRDPGWMVCYAALTDGRQEQKTVLSFYMFDGHASPTLSITTGYCG